MYFVEFDEKNHRRNDGETKENDGARDPEFDRLSAIGCLSGSKGVTLCRCGEHEQEDLMRSVERPRSPTGEARGGALSGMDALGRG